MKLVEFMKTVVLTSLGLLYQGQGSGDMLISELECKVEGEAIAANVCQASKYWKSVVRIGVVEDDGDSPFLLADVQFVAGRNDNRSSFEIQALQVFTDQSLEIPAGDDNVLLISVPFRTELRSLCSLLGVALHYAWLVVVLWTSACSFHMFHVFVTQQSSLHMPHRHAWYLKRYTLFAHGVPALIVITVVCASLLMSDGQEMGYGKDICYLDSVLLVGVGFVLPLALCVTFNLVQLALTAHALSPVQHVQAYGVETERSNIRIYIKLSSLTGMCWVVALLAEVPGCEWMRYVAVVLNGLQGPHLALSYTASSRVMRLWARLLNGQHSKRKRKFHTSSSSSKTNKSKVTTL
nr:hypothetical protein BaRGS_009245 [Batillaria attramentaria]